mgnify:CR=1 FL=1
MFSKPEYSHDAADVLQGLSTFTSTLSSKDALWHMQSPFAPSEHSRLFVKMLPRVSLFIYFYSSNVSTSTPTSYQLLDSTMRFFWMTIAATLGPIVALINNSTQPENLQALAAGTLLPATVAGDEYSDDEDEDDFPTTPLDDESWIKLKCKGDNLMKAMHATDEEAGKVFSPILSSAESQWDDFGKYLHFFSAR